MKRPSPFRYLLLIIPVGLVILLAGVLRTQLARMAGITTPEAPVVETEIDSTPLPPEELAGIPEISGCGSRKAEDRQIPVFLFTTQKSIMSN